MREKKSALAQSIEIVRRRIDETGTAEPFIQQQGTDRILIQLPGLDDPTRIKNLLGQTAKLQFRFVDMSASAEPGKPSLGNDVLPSQDSHNGKPIYYAVNKQQIVSGENLTDAQPGFDEYNRPVVSLTFDSLGGKKFGDATKNNIGKLFAIVLDNKVLSAPRINGYIPRWTCSNLWILYGSGGSGFGPSHASWRPPRSFKNP
jgi:protein-export membrane protein SecD